MKIVNTITNIFKIYTTGTIVYSSGN